MQIEQRAKKIKLSEEELLDKSHLPVMMVMNMSEDLCWIINGGSNKDHSYER